MARQLRSAGETIALLLLIAITPYDFPSLVAPTVLERFLRPRLAQRVADHRARSLFRVLGDGARRAFSRAAQQASEWAGSAADRLREVAGRPTRARPREADRISRRVFAAHGPRADPGPVAISLSGRSREQYSQDPVADFRGLSTGELSVDEIACHDGWMLIEPHVAELARRLRKRLDWSEGGSRVTGVTRPV
jgi:hypothetical protein